MDKKAKKLREIMDARNLLRLEWEAKGKPNIDFYHWLLERHDSLMKKLKESYGNQ